MYLYLYDSFLNASKYNRLLSKIEMRLTDLGIGGKISRLSPLKNIKELIRDEIKNGVKTVVAVGNDKTVIQIVNDIAEYNVCLGIIPIGKDNKIADALGIEPAEEACPTLSARKLEKIDLGRVNNMYFLSSLTIPSSQATLECESQYQIKPAFGKHQIAICNLRPEFATATEGTKQFNPSDGMLEAWISPAKRSFSVFGTKKTPGSVFPFKKLHITSKNSLSVITDGEKILKTPVEVEVVPKKLRVIVGKKRAF